MSNLVSRLYNWVTDKANGIKITASRQDAELNQLVSSLNAKVLCSASAPSNPIAGQTWVDTTNKLVKVYLNNAWIDLPTIVSPVQGDLIYYNGTQWVRIAPNTPSAPIVASANYVFTVSGITTVPTAGAVYTNNTQTFTVVSANGNYVYATGTGAPSTGNLVKSSGTGDATIAFSAWGAQLPALDGQNLTGTNWGPVQNGSVNAVSSFTISNLVPGKKYKLVFNLLQNGGSTPYLTMTFNGDTGANYNWAHYSNSYTGQTGISMGICAQAGKNSLGEYLIQPISADNKKVMTIGLIATNDSSQVIYDNSGYYAGASALSSITLAVASGTLTGNWTLYQLG